MSLSRRDFGKVALAALPASRLLAKTNSKFGGVQIGINAPYSFHGAYNSGDECLGRDSETQPQLGGTARAAYRAVHGSAGQPGGLSGGPARRRSRRAMRRRRPRRASAAAPPTPEQIAARKADAEELRKWRLAASMDTVKAFRKKYEDAGVKIEIVKVDAIDTFSDEEIDYMFGLAKTAGANAISCEIPLSHTKRLGEFGEKHKMMIGYHGHTDITSPEAFGRPESWETAMSYSKYNGINLDIGHFTAGQ